MVLGPSISEPLLWLRPPCPLATVHRDPPGTLLHLRPRLWLRSRSLTTFSLSTVDQDPRLLLSPTPALCLPSCLALPSELLFPVATCILSSAPALDGEPSAPHEQD